MTKEEFLQNMDKVGNQCFNNKWKEGYFTCNTMMILFGVSSKISLLYSKIFDRGGETLTFYTDDDEIDYEKSATARVCALKTFEYYVLDNELYLKF